VDPHGTRVEAQRPDEDAGGHVVAAVEEIDGALRATEQESAQLHLIEIGEDGTPAEDVSMTDINESNPSFNRNFVEPCIVSFGHRKVNEHLLDVVEHGSLLEIAGAVLGNEGLLKPLPERPVVDET
jgi:hypothetical protein